MQPHSFHSLTHSLSLFGAGFWLLALRCFPLICLFGFKSFLFFSHSSRRVLVRLNSLTISPPAGLLLDLLLLSP
ncbi:uncharacterized protein BO88DRAFT_44244 [Aspergillus vadensis CBS 113365]|uniref:Uncharacterized protein n=1 Tax=Aspergillus vadensis (strain CBS 113365 / IMI 142717 / IBT 24658) TaxID=1448311 RepID=A0A319BA08_ASPVC|nr:hypothetical protein BO88DRAFT_44244 [Aspergillus vadensis CBS 113365]PYH69219.1 hypothetical protein BO88DRAFT_44244 [Aspergillus vadensis CBS 113365]